MEIHRGGYLFLGAWGPKSPAVITQWGPSGDLSPGQSNDRCGVEVLFFMFFGSSRVKAIHFFLLKKCHAMIFFVNFIGACFDTNGFCG